jgi:hypothetical protein
MSKLLDLPPEIFDELSSYLDVICSGSVWTSHLSSIKKSNQICSESFYHEVKGGYSYNPPYSMVYRDPLLSLHATGNKLLHAKLFRCKQLVLDVTKSRMTLLLPLCAHLKKLTIAFDMFLQIQHALPHSLTRLDITDPSTNYVCNKLDSDIDCAFPESLTHFSFNSKNWMCNIFISFTALLKILDSLPKTLLFLDFPGIENSIRMRFPELTHLIFNRKYHTTMTFDLDWFFLPENIMSFESTAWYDSVDFDNIPKYLTELKLPVAYNKISDNQISELPANLTKLHIAKIVGLTENCVSFLPRSLTSLEIKICVQNRISFFNKLPPHLIHLHLNCQGKLYLSNSDNLPQTLTSLYLYVKEINNIIVFPPKLTTLTFFSNDSMKKSVWDNVPPSLTRLSSTYQFTPRDFVIGQNYEHVRHKKYCKKYSDVWCLLGLPKKLRYINLSHCKLNEKLRKCFTEAFPGIEILN